MLGSRLRYKPAPVSSEDAHGSFTTQVTLPKRTSTAHPESGNGRIKELNYPSWYSARHCVVHHVIMCCDSSYPQSLQTSVRFMPWNTWLCNTVQCNCTIQYERFSSKHNKTCSLRYIAGPFQPSKDLRPHAPSPSSFGSERMEHEISGYRISQLFLNSTQRKMFSHDAFVTGT